MNKIILSILAIALTVGVVSGTAYALFFDTVNVAGITMSSGNADLEVYDGGTSILIADWVSALNTSGKLQNLYPGWKDYTVMDFENKSLSTIGLNLKAQLTSASGDWNTLKDKIWIAISNTGDSQNFPTSGWHTLAEWNTAPISFGTTLARGAKTPYKVFIQILDSVGNEIAQKSLSNVTIVFSGTQATP